MTVTVASGVTSTNLTISAGDPLVVRSGGVVLSSTILNDGVATLSSGAIGEFLTVASGGLLRGAGSIGASIADFGVVSGLSNFGVLTVDPYGQARDLQVYLGGVEVISSGGIALGDTILSGGLLSLGGGAVSNETVLSGGAVKLGGTIASDLTAGPVTSPETLSGVTISSGGIVELNTATVLDGVTLSLTSGGTAYDVTVAAGAVVKGAGALLGSAAVAGEISGVTVGDYDAFQLTQGEILAGGSAVDVTLTGGDEEDEGNSLQIDSGATATGTMVTGGAVLFVDGTASGTSLASGGEVIFAGGGDSGVTVGGGGNLQVDGGTADVVTIQDGGRASIGPGSGTVSGVTVRNGGDFEIDGGTAGAVTVESGATLEYFSGAAAKVVVRSGATFDFGGALTGDFTVGPVTSTTVLDGVTISSGGLIDLEAVTVSSGVTVTVASGGTAGGLDVLKGGVVKGPGDVDGFTTVAGAISGVSLVEGYIELRSGGSASGVTVLSGASVQSNFILVDSGATATGTIVEGNAALDVDGFAVGTQLESGASETVSRGSVSAETIHDGAIELVYDGVASGTTLLSGGRVYVEGGGRTVGAVISAGGVERVIGATTTGTVLSGGDEVVSSGGVARATIVLSGGREYLTSGAVDANTIVSSGGSELISAGGVADALSVLSGGVLFDEGEVRIAGAGTLDGTLSGSGAIIQTTAGDLLISGVGARFSGKAAIEGGTIELATSGALGTGYVEFVEPATGSAVLQIDAADAPAAGGTFSNTIDNFSGAHEDIDLRSIAYVAGASATVSGSTLVLTDGGKTYKFKLAGSVAGAYPVLSDGHGGTLIDPDVARFAQTAAAFAPADAAKTALVSATSPVAQSPFAHATASAGAGHR